jgi:inorganic pyrophosphatase/exopolyphosphatase
LQLSLLDHNRLAVHQHKYADFVTSIVDHHVDEKFAFRQLSDDLKIIQAVVCWLFQANLQNPNSEL